jgi:hypothetical protein
MKHAIFATTMLCAAGTAALAEEGEGPKLTPEMIAEGHVATLVDAESESGINGLMLGLILMDLGLAVVGG